VEYFGEDAFDVLVSTELLEHVRDWRRAVDNKESAEKWRIYMYHHDSYGFPHHGYPYGLSSNVDGKFQINMKAFPFVCSMFKLLLES